MRRRAHPLALRLAQQLLAAFGLTRKRRSAGRVRAATETVPPALSAGEAPACAQPLWAACSWDPTEIDAALTRGGMPRPPHMLLEVWLESRCE